MNLATAIVWSVWLMYSSMEIFSGGTLGKKLFGLRIARQDGKADQWRLFSPLADQAVPRDRYGGLRVDEPRRDSPAGRDQRTPSSSSAASLPQTTTASRGTISGQGRGLSRPKRSGSRKLARKEGEWGGDPLIARHESFAAKSRTTPHLSRDIAMRRRINESHAPLLLAFVHGNERRAVGTRQTWRMKPFRSMSGSGATSQPVFNAGDRKAVFVRHGISSSLPTSRLDRPVNLIPRKLGWANPLHGNARPIPR